MPGVLFLIWLFLTLSSGPQPNRKEQVIFARIEYIYHLKDYINQAVWPGFADKKYDLPLIYYTDSTCYVANPTLKFITSFKPGLVFENKDLEIYKTRLLDSIPFHMETGMTFGDSSSAFNYKSPFMNCSSFEITQKTIPDVNSTEQWTTMILHEYFHGFQFKHSAHLTYFEKNIAMAGDTLKKIYQLQKWFKESIDKENQILLAALDERSDIQIKKLLDSFFQLREQRRRQTRQKLNFNIKPVEQTYETMEGTARYAEYSLYRYFATKEPDNTLLKTDSAYHAYQYFRNHSLEKDQWLYLTDKTTYFYATGFNLVRLLDKLKVNYKTRLFTEGGLSPEQLLKQYLAKNKDR